MMRKRVTFVEHLKKENLYKNGSGHMLIRSADSDKRCTNVFECLPSQHVREMYKGTHMNVPAGGQHMKTIHAPKSMMSAPFLQHPGLTAGQRHYLCSIASVYSTEHMRRQMKQHYLNALHTCLQSGQKDTCRRKYEHQRRENSTFPKGAEEDTTRANKPQRQRKSSDRANCDVILPKIVNR